MKKLIPIFLIFTLLLTSCGVVEKKAHGGKLQVYTSFYAVNDFAKTIGGDKADVYCVTPAGAEPHDFEPTAADIAKINNADIFIYNGNGIDDWAKDVAEKLPESVTVVCATDGLSVVKGDPHIWLSLTESYEILQNICLAYAETDIENKQYYFDNYQSCKNKIHDMGVRYHNAGFAGKNLFVTHGAYAYLCKDWDMKQVDLEGISGDSDPSPAQIAEFVENMKESGAKAIFYDPLEGDKVAGAVAKEAGVEALELYTFEGDSQGRDYITIMELNLEQLKKGLN